MHYVIGEYLIRSELAARSTQKPSRHVLEWISCLPSESQVLDYGCGKLRYTLPLSKKVANVVAVDSAKQLAKVQRIGTTRTTIQHYVKQMLPNVEAHTIDSPLWISKKYTHVLCANVLSSIPDISERINVLSRIRSVITTDSIVLFCHQYTNSYFKKIAEKNISKPLLDGWLNPTKNGATFFGIIQADPFIHFCQNNGLEVVSCYHRGQSIFTEARRAS